MVSLDQEGDHGAYDQDRLEAFAQYDKERLPERGNRILSGFACECHNPRERIRNLITRKSRRFSITTRNRDFEIGEGAFEGCHQSLSLIHISEPTRQAE